jgi:N6-L-threonylcarbamoyladenine synthase
MIAWAGAERLALDLTDPLDIAPRARWPLEEVAGPAKFGFTFEGSDQPSNLA